MLLYLLVENTKQVTFLVLLQILLVIEYLWIVES